MKRILSLFLVIIGLFGCLKVDRGYIAWTGEKEIPKSGGTVVWKPIKSDVRVIPEINSVILSLYDSEGNLIEMEQSQNTSGDCYEIKTSINKISFYMSANDSGYMREIQLAFKDGSRCGNYIMIQQDY